MLIQRRFPELDSGSLSRIGRGWDNVVWATVDGIAFRFPRRQVAIPGVEREIALLPTLAPRLPLAIPNAAHVGSPSAEFAWPWFGSQLIPSQEIAVVHLADAQRIALASRLGTFLPTLHGLALPGADALPLDPTRRTDMAVRVPLTREALAAAKAFWRAPHRVDGLLQKAALLPTPQTTGLAHGDLHVRHLLVDDADKLVGIIDWGDLCRAHPSIDLSLYWSLLPPAGRSAFLDAYGPVEEHGLLRARVLALFLCATLATYAHAEALHDLRREAVQGLERTVID